MLMGILNNCLCNIFNLIGHFIHLVWICKKPIIPLLYCPSLETLEGVWLTPVMSIDLPYHWSYSQSLWYPCTYTCLKRIASHKTISIVRCQWRHCNLPLNHRHQNIWCSITWLPIAERENLISFFSRRCFTELYYMLSMQKIFLQGYPFAGLQFVTEE